MIFLSLLLAPNAVAATTAARIVLVGSSHEELARKVRAEAEHAGILVTAERGAAPSGDAELLRRHDAVGLIELRSPERVRIYVAPSGEHAAYEATIDRAPADGDGFAVRVVEQLRGRLVELEILPPEPSGAPAVAAAAKAPETPREEKPTAPETPRAPVSSPTLGLSIGGSAVVALGGLGVTPGIALGLRLDPAAPWAVSIHALLPVAENDVYEPEGAASVRVNLVFAELAYRLLPASSPVRPEIGAGAGLVILPMEGETTAPREAHADQLVSGIYFLESGAAWAPNSWLRVRGAVRAGLSAPRPTLEFSGREVAAWGRTFGAATLEAEFQLPLSAGEGTP